MASLARRFPPKHVAERVLPWFTVLLAAIAGFWAIYEYRSDVGTSRVQTVLELHKRFTENHSEQARSIQEAAGLTTADIKKIRCEFYVEIYQGNATDGLPLGFPECSNISPDDIPVLDQVASRLDVGMRDTLRERLNVFRADRVDLDLHETEQMLGFFRAVVVCVEKRNCDRGTALALFAQDMTAFLNIACVPDNQLSASLRSEMKSVARYLVDSGIGSSIPWSQDTNRQKLFACEFLRELE